MTEPLSDAPRIELSTYADGLPAIIVSVGDDRWPIEDVGGKAVLMAYRKWLNVESHDPGLVDDFWTPEQAANIIQAHYARYKRGECDQTEVAVLIETASVLARTVLVNQISDDAEVY